MSKHKKFSNWYYDDEEEHQEVYNDKRKRLIEKRMKTALKSRNVDRLLELEDDD
jgi:hypothetical protein